MKRGKPIVLLLTILLAAVAMVFGRNEIGMRNFPFSVIITSGGVQKEIFSTKLADGYYMFLPGYAEGENARIYLNPIYDVALDGQKLEQNQLCADFPVNTELDLQFRSAGKEDHETFMFVTSANVATMYIDVPSGDMEYIHAKKGNSEAGRIQVYREDGTLDYTGEVETIKGRGNATWLYDKKPYSLELRREADLLGLGKAGRWILLSNAHDYSHLRNRIAFDMAKAVDMPYSPDSAWTDLYLNGEYAGLYLLSERNEVHPRRVAIDAENSFLVSVEPKWRLYEQGYAHVKTKGGTAFRIHNSAMPPETIQQILQTAENAIFAEDGHDSATGKRWDEIIDLDSWARKYLLTEILVNQDAGLASDFFFYEASAGVICAGPVWDMDVTLINTELPWLSHRTIVAGRPHLTGTEDRNFFYELLQKPEFRDRVTELYRTEFRPLLVRLLDTGLDEYAQKTQQAALSNRIRWKERERDKNIAEMRKFIEKRMEFLDSFWIDEEPFFLVQVQENDRMWAFAVSPGETLEHLPVSEGEVWYRVDTEEILDRSAPVNSDLMISARSQS